VPKTYTSIEAFYADKPERAQSGEADYGVWWTAPGLSWPKWRVSYVHKTGEVYAVQLAGPGLLKILGIVPPDTEGSYYQTLDRILEGWADAIHKPGSLIWIEGKFG